MANIKDVAKLTGYGTSTISRYFNGGYVSEEKKNIIELACKELKYTPNSLARAVKTKRTYTICLVVPNISYFFFSELSAFIQQTCMKRGYKVLLINALDSDALREINQSHLHHGLVDGAIIVTLYQGVEDLEYDVPVVFLEKLRNQKQKQSCVYVDQYEGAFQACEYLIEKGCKKIAYLKGNKSYNIALEREQAYLHCMNKYNYDATILDSIELKEGDSLFLKKNGFDGVFAWNDYAAAQFMDYCRKSSICIPDDIQLIGYDDVSLARYLYPQLTTIAQPIEMLGTYAADTLMNKIEGKQKEEIRVTLDTTLIVRNTTL